MKTYRVPLGRREVLVLIIAHGRVVQACIYCEPSG